MSVVHFTIGRKVYFADYQQDRPEKADLKEGTYVYDLQENQKGEIVYIVPAAYRRRAGSIVINEQIPLNEKKRAVMSEIIFHEQLPDEVEESDANDKPWIDDNDEHGSQSVECIKPTPKYFTVRINDPLETGVWSSN